MVKDWEFHKNEIKELYIDHDNTLENVMIIMLSRYGFKASERAYKMKLDDWSLKKYKNRQKLQYSDQKGDTTPNSSVSGSILTSSKANVGRNSSAIDIESQPRVFRPPGAVEEIPKPSSRSTWDRPTEPQIISPSLAEFFPSCPMGPVVNSSLMFFSTRSATESLEMLAKFPNMAPRALETLLRNWKINSQHLDYALSFLQKREFCHSIVGVNWTRWTDRDETLFDLIEDIDSEKERKILVKALLAADLRFQHGLARRNALWAEDWRRACQQTEWACVRRELMKMQVSTKMRIAAFEVLGQHCLEILRVQIKWLNENGGGEGNVGLRVPYNDIREEYLAIVRSCKQREVEVGSSWFRDHLGLNDK